MRILLAIMTGVLFLSLAGCSGQSNTYSTVTKTTSSDPTNEESHNHTLENKAKEESVLLSDNRNEESDSKEKNYKQLSEFSVVGKWKNKGKDTYGQAQKNAIIVFTDSNCNFYSPVDTYAFYKDGDEYRLDCTSLLGETVSFKVKTIDADHMDIFYSGGIVELERIKEN